MKIDSYEFGSITIDGKMYTSDVVIYPGRVDAAWWRKEGHRLQPADLADVVNARPGIVVVGTGYAGVMAVPEATKNFLTSKGIDVRVARTGKAVDTFNTLQGGNKVVIAALHITC